MRPIVLVPVLAAVLAVVVVVATPQPTPGPTRAAGPALPTQGVVGKPRPLLGHLELEAVERPAPDRAWVRARWVRADGAHGCRLDLILPAGATLLSGEASVPVDDAATAGEASWLLDVPTGQDLDLTARLCGTTDLGDQALEAYLPLARR